MAWTHYTAPLEEGDELTASMVAEVLAALTERLAAIDPDWCVESAEPEEIALRASGLETHRVYYTGPATSGGGTVTNGLGEISAVVATLSTSYLRPKFIEAGTGTSGAYSGTAVLTEALADLGESITTPASWTAATQETRVHWNMVRAAIQLLRWISLPSIGVSDVRKTSNGSSLGVSGLAPVVADYAAQAPAAFATPVMAIQRLDGERGDSLFLTPNFGVSGFAITGSTITVPTAAPWVAGWTPAIRPTWAADGTGPTFFALAGEIGIDGTAVAFSAGAGPGVAPWEVIAVPLTSTGVLAATAHLDGWADGSTFAAMSAALPWVGNGGDPEVEYQSGGCRLTSALLAGSPTWVYPAD